MPLPVRVGIRGDEDGAVVVLVEVGAADAVAADLYRVRSHVIDALTPTQLEQLRGIADALLTRLDPEGRMFGLHSRAESLP